MVRKALRDVGLTHIASQTVLPIAQGALAGLRPPSAASSYKTTGRMKEVHYRQVRAAEPSYTVRIRTLDGIGSENRRSCIEPLSHRPRHALRVSDGPTRRPRLRSFTVDPRNATRGPSVCSMS